MAKFSTEPKAMMQILKKEDILLIHENALNILEETGVRFDSQRALQLLEDKGCIVDHESHMVKFPRKLVNWAIVQSSKMFSFATGSIVPDDCTGAEGADLYILHEALKMTDKPFLAETWEEDSVDKVCQIIREIRGSKEACIEKPFIILSACPSWI